MKIGGYLGNQAHAPANSRTALISAYTGGASVLHFATRWTADRRIVLAQSDDISAATGTEGRIGSMTLAALRQVDFSKRFTPRGSALGDFNYFDPAVEGRRFSLDAFDEIVSELPRDVDWLIEIGPEDAARRALTLGARVRDNVCHRPLQDKVSECADRALAAHRAGAPQHCASRLRRPRRRGGTLLA
jgi:glycerophosphoryl diester phosphodiesterase